MKSRRERIVATLQDDASIPRDRMLQTILDQEHLTDLDVLATALTGSVLWVVTKINFEMFALYSVHWNKTRMGAVNRCYSNYNLESLAQYIQGMPRLWNLVGDQLLNLVREQHEVDESRPDEMIPEDYYS